MQVRKTADAGQGTAVDERELELINQWSRKRLEAGEVYAFCVRLCDNEVDRDGERFTVKTLEELGTLFVGKSGIFDHQWSAKGQTARIYRTELVREENVLTEAGEGYCYLKGYAYMLRTEGNGALIAEIEGGIKREVSVGCAVERASCSICGEDLRAGKRCAHVKGERYGGKLCWTELEGATDAYEWSFVAVPAQKRAGVIKSMGKGANGMELKEFLRERPEYLEEVARLEEEAGAGRRYLAALRGEVARLGGMAEPGLDAEVLRGIVEKLGEAELGELRRVYRKKVDERYCAGVQLPHGDGERAESERDGAFLI